MAVTDVSLEGVRFRPWIGEHYGADNRFGIRVLVLGEAHYGAEGSEKPTETEGVVRWCTQRARTGEGERARFFTVLANVLRGQGGWIDDNDLAQVFQEIAFYIFVQTFVRSASRRDPSFRQWVDAQAASRRCLRRCSQTLFWCWGRGCGITSSNGPRTSRMR